MKGLRMIFPKRHRIGDEPAQADARETDPIPFPESWYALAASASLKAGDLRSMRFLDRDWVLFRDEEGRPGLISRHCPHMGADLSEGRVRGRNLVCPMHQWGFTPEGGCNAKLPPGQSEAAVLPSLAVEDWAGILFAFAAPAAGYGLPRHLVPTGARFSRSTSTPFPFHWILPALNTFDLSHFSRIHHREFVGEPEITSDGSDHLAVRFSARVLAHRLRDKIFKALGFGRFEVSIDCWGGMLLIMRNHTTRVGAVIGVGPMGPFHSRLYVATFGMDVPKRWLSRILQPMKLEIGRIATHAFLKADIPVLKGMRPRAGVLVAGQDDGVIRFWKHFNGLPKVPQGSGQT